MDCSILASPFFLFWQDTLYCYEYSGVRMNQIPVDTRKAIIYSHLGGGAHCLGFSSDEIIKYLQSNE